MNLKNRIFELKKQRNAMIFAHYYVADEIQEIADFLGDSLFLAQKAKETNADIILFCGVNFMAETAKILNPSKTVLTPDNTASCSLAECVDIDECLKWKNSFRNPYLISYINCSTQVKTISDVICTSSNVLKIVNSAPKDATVLFAPDENLGNWINKKLGINMQLWKGNCVVHQNYSEKNLIECKKNHPDAKIVAHPECPANLLSYADFVGSTTAIIDFTKQIETQNIIVLTENGILRKLKIDSPNKNFLTVKGMTDDNKQNICFDMKKHTLEKVAAALENLENVVTVAENLSTAALIPLEKMLEIK
jgi:quinolinate synthase